MQSLVPGDDREKVLPVHREKIKKIMYSHPLSD
jgi:hypothetical protein